MATNSNKREIIISTESDELIASINDLNDTEVVAKLEGCTDEDNEIVYAHIAGTVAPATEISRGVIRLATNQEVLDGMSSNTAVSPNGLKILIEAVKKGTTYIHYQTVASTKWEIPHNMGRFPSVTVVDSAGTEVEVAVTYNDKNNCTLEMSAPFKGTAYLN